MAIRKLKSSLYDVVIGEVAGDSVGLMIAQSLAVKGFCVVNVGFEEDALRAALDDTKALDFYQVNAAVAEGLLGAEGSSAVADLDPVEDDGKDEIGNLRAMDTAITRMGYILEPYLASIDVDITHRSAAVLSRAGEAEEETPPLNEVEASKWQSQFLRHKIMVIMFLGPKTGSLTLQLFNAEEAEPHIIKTPPGSMVLLRADKMLHRYTAPGDAYAISSFFMSETLRKRGPEGGYLLTPAAKQIEDWVFSRLKVLKEMQDAGNPHDDQVPDGWRKAMNHSFRKGQMAGVTGVGIHWGCTYDIDEWFKACACGPDYAIEVPNARWDHGAQYDPDPLSWQWGKSFSRHGAFIEGIELFDNKFFNLSPNEARGLDPHQRCLMEQGYNSLAHSGWNKKKLMNSAIGIYVGCGNDEWAFHPTKGSMGGIMGTLCMYSGRFSFCLGTKGPAITIMNEAASGHSAIRLAAESVFKKGLAVSNDYGLAVGVNFMVSSMWWNSHCQKGWLGKKGRCLAFDASADGYCRGDGCGAIAFKGSTQVVDSKLVADEKDKFLGIVAGCQMNQNGKCASLDTPHGPALQECMTQAVSNAGISPLDVDGVDCDTKGNFLWDAIETSSLWRAHRNDLQHDPLCFSSTKSSVGNQVDSAGCSSFLKVVYGGQWGNIPPTLHVRSVNPHIDAWQDPIMLMTESIETPYRSSYYGVSGCGHGGSNVYIVAWATLDSVKRPPPPPLGTRPGEELLFWPAGGGSLEGDMMPRRSDGYFIVGSWTAWEEPQKMTPVGGDEYTFTVTMGPNGWEQFQIWLDGDKSRALTPEEPKSFSGVRLVGPEPDTVMDLATLRGGTAPTWLIDGRPDPRKWPQRTAYPGLTNGDGGTATETEDDRGVGDQYRVLLSLSGRWRTVTWERLPKPSIPPPIRVGTYQIVGNFNDWSPQEMEADPSTPGLWTAEVRLFFAIADFQIMMDSDWSQVFYPNPYASGEGADDILGPDNLGLGMAWCIDGRAGEKYSVQFQRSFEDGKESRKVKFQCVGKAPLTAAERWAQGRIQE